MIVDAQIHLWADDRPGRPWPAGTSSAGHRRLSLDEILDEMDQAGVGRAVLIPPSWEGERNDLVTAAVRAHRDRFRGMGRVPAGSGPATIAAWTETDDALAGIRITAHRGWQRAWVATDQGEWLWAAAEAADVPVMLYAPGLERRIARIAKRHPGLRLAIDHANVGLDITPVTIPEAIQRLLPLARLANVSVKASALECHVAGPSRLRLIDNIVERLVAAFGANRVFWGTDLTRIPCGYGDAIAAFTKGLPGLTDDERTLVMGEAVSRWLSWPAADLPAERRRVSGESRDQQRPSRRLAERDA